MTNKTKEELLKEAFADLSKADADWDKAYALIKELEKEYGK